MQDIFDNDNRNLGVLINSKNIFQNINYKLKKDRNCIHFFKNIVNNIKNYDKLKNMEQFYFDNDFNEIVPLLNKYAYALKSDLFFKTKNYNEFSKPCSLFPDHIGKSIITFLGYLPLLNTFNEKLTYIKYISKEIDLEKKFMGATYLEDQYEKLFEKNIFSKRYPSDDDFIDYKLRNKYIKKLKKDVDINKINESIDLMLNVFKEKNDEEIKKIFFTMGCTYWESITNNSNSNSDLMKTFNLFLENFKKEKEIKLERIKKIL